MINIFVYNHIISYYDTAANGKITFFALSNTAIKNLSLATLLIRLVNDSMSLSHSRDSRSSHVSRNVSRRRNDFMEKRRSC